MTLSTMTPTGSGSMTAKFSPRTRLGYQPSAPWLKSAARDFGKQPSTIKAMVSHPQDNVFITGQRLLGHMLAAGELALAERKAAVIDLAWVAVPAEPLPVVIERETRIDSDQDVSRDLWLLKHTDDELTALERNTLREVAVKQSLIRSIQAVRKARI